MRETPDFESFLPVSRLESEISRIIAEVAISCRFDFLSMKFQIMILRCLSYLTFNIERLLRNPGMPL